MNYLENFNIWKENIKDEELKTELLNLKEEEVKECFYKDLEFGTGGLRGIIGVGTNRMNIYTVMKATLGYSNYLKKQSNPAVAIAYDSRNKSQIFAKKAAEVFANNGIKVYIFEELMPTPLLSFAVRELKLSGGIVITASHNPACYNGYKVYGADGCQITQDAANEIYKEIEKVDIFNDIEIIDFESTLKDNKINYINEQLINQYMDYVFDNSLHENNVKSNIKIVYTPLNGTGRMPVLKALERAGYKDILIPKDQEYPDSNFSTCPKPNPEEEDALKLGISLAQSNDADIVLATDPDCDRVGVAVKTNSGYRLISGQEMGVLLLNYICQNQKLPQNPVAIKTIVTTDMAKYIAENYGVEIINVLTGFKYIGEQIGILENNNELDKYIFGFEESYGYLTHTKVRDKDAVDASLTICEMVSFYKEKNKTLIDVLEELYQKYGYFVQKLKSFEFKGVDGNDKMIKLLNKLKNNPPKEWKNNKLIYLEDYETSERYDIDGNIARILLPKSNVLKLIFENEITVTVRPSGTEPKLKLYYSVKGNSLENAQNMINEFVEYFEKTIIGL